SAMSDLHISWSRAGHHVKSTTICLIQGCGLLSLCAAQQRAKRLAGFPQGLAPSPVRRDTFAVPRAARSRGRPMESEEIRELRATLLRLKQEHRDLDSAINALEESGRADALQLKRLKKKKLSLKDEIARIEDQLLPDIIA